MVLKSDKIDEQLEPSDNSWTSGDTGNRRVGPQCSHRLYPARVLARARLLQGSALLTHQPGDFSKGVKWFFRIVVSNYWRERESANCPWTTQGIVWHIILTRALDSTPGPRQHQFHCQVSRWFEEISLTWSPISSASRTRACVIFSVMVTLLPSTGTLRIPNYGRWSYSVVKGMGHNKDLWR